MWPNQRIILGEHALGMKIKQQLKYFVPGKFQAFHLKQCNFFLCDFQYHKHLMN